MDKLIIPCIYLEQEKAKTGFGSKEDFSQSNPKLLAKTYGNGGADELLVFDFSMEDADHEKAIAAIKEICMAAEVPVIGAGNIRRMEDVKKLIYAGCAKTVWNFAKPSRCV